MTDEALQSRLVEAGKLFQSKQYADCEALLIKPIGGAQVVSDLKLKHNVAITHYLSKGGDSREAIQALSSRSATGGGGESESVALEYEGHEIAHYNRAVLLAHNGRSEEAANVLRDLLQLHESISTTVLCRGLCLLQLVTNGTLVGKNITRGKGTIRSKSDDELTAKIVAQYMPEFKKDPQLAKMLNMSLASDGSALHEPFKNSSSPVERAIYFNDLGIMAMSEGKANLAALYLTKANRFASEAQADSFLRHSMLYNFAVCCIHRNDFGPAMKALLIAQESMKSSPTLWLRLGQATLGFHTLFASLHVQDSHDAQQKELGAALAKGSAFSGFQLLQIPDGDNLLTGDAQRRVYLVVASKAIQNCVHLLKGNCFAEGVEAAFSQGRSSDYKLLQYSYIYGAAIEMLQQNYSVAIRLCSDLIAQHKSRPLMIDVHATALLYLSEAYCRVNKCKKALDVLAGASLGELLLTVDRTDGQQRLRTEALFVNLVLVHIANGSFKQAQTLMSSLIAKIANSQNSTVAARTAVVLQVYLDLAQGNKDKALETMAKTAMAVPAVQI